MKDFQVNFHPQRKPPPQSTASPMPEGYEESQGESSASKEAKRQKEHSLLDEQIQQKMLSQEQHAATEKEANR